VQGGAIAILLNGEAAAGQLACTMSGAGEPQAAEATQQVSHAGEESNTSADESFATQSQALLHCLETGSPAVWQGAGATWHWRWHERAA
jgi:hypothetical protein